MKRFFKPQCFPESIDPVLQLAHNSAGHNGFQRVYLSIRQLYYWNNMKKDILCHCKQCAVCEKFKVEHIKFEKLHFSIPNQPMEFICMDLIGEFYPPTSRGHRYALTVMDMLTGFVFCNHSSPRRQRRQFKHTLMKFISDLGVPGKSCQTMELNSKPKCLK